MFTPDTSFVLKEPAWPWCCIFIAYPSIKHPVKETFSIHGRFAINTNKTCSHKAICLARLLHVAHAYTLSHMNVPHICRVVNRSHNSVDVHAFIFILSTCFNQISTVVQVLDFSYGDWLRPKYFSLMAVSTMFPLTQTIMMHTDLSVVNQKWVVGRAYGHWVMDPEILKEEEKEIEKE